MPEAAVDGVLQRLHIRQSHHPTFSRQVGRDDRTPYKRRPRGERLFPLVPETALMRNEPEQFRSSRIPHSRNYPATHILSQPRHLALVPVLLHQQQAVDVAFVHAPQRKICATDSREHPQKRPVRSWLHS